MKALILALSLVATSLVGRSADIVQPAASKPSAGDWFNAIVNAKPANVPQWWADQAAQAVVGKSTAEGVKGSGDWWSSTYKLIRSGIQSILSKSFGEFKAPLEKVRLIGLSIAFFLLVYSLVKGFQQTQAGGYMNLQHVIVKTIVLTGLMAFTPTMIEWATGGADDIAAQIGGGPSPVAGAAQGQFPLTDKAGATVASCAAAWRSESGIQSALNNFGLLVAIDISVCGLVIADAILMFLYVFRELATMFSAATLPLGIAMLAVGMLQGIGQKWIVGLISVVLWPVGFALVNILAMPVATWACGLVGDNTNIFKAILGAPILALVLVMASLLYIGATKVIGAALSGAGDMGGGIVGGAVAMPFKVGGAAAGGAAMVAAAAATGGTAAAGMAAAKTAASTARAASK
jgi:hypothetical protein